MARRPQRRRDSAPEGPTKAVFCPNALLLGLDRGHVCGMAAMNSAALFNPTEEHEMLRDQVRRFVEQEIKPHGEAWEEQGFVPREVLRKMGELGFFGIRYPARRS